ncbi:MAG: GGDEF domain-containing protein [Burkholderiales bacterium]|nr:GGDEF domain-containing protein [Burkholderiales bacterium]
METLLQHIAEITRNRDHDLLDLSVISALYHMTEANQVRALEIVPVRDELFIQEKAWIKDGQAISASTAGEEGEEEKSSLTSYPVLLDCLHRKGPEAMEVASSGESILWMPIWLNEKINGCIKLESDKPFSSETLQVIHGIVEVYRNYQGLIDYSERDSLTGLLNRKTFDEKFARMASSVTGHERHNLSPEEERRLSSESNESKSNWLAVVDIDHFKRINDTFGHLYGDEVLILVANMLKSSFRVQDRVFRFGGEEFVILLRSVTLESARKALERFRQTVEQYNIPQVGKVTLSVGFVSITAETPVVILGHADQALYFAKENGRNQVQFYDELVAIGALKSEAANDDVEFF